MPRCGGNVVGTGKGFCCETKSWFCTLEENKFYNEEKDFDKR